MARPVTGRSSEAETVSVGVAVGLAPAAEGPVNGRKAVPVAVGVTVAVAV